METGKFASRSSSDFTDESELGEEEKMDKFYELIRRFSVARDYQRRILQSPDHHHQKINKGADQDHDHQPSWVPSFKWEDFKNVEDVNFSKNVTSDDDHDHQHHKPNHHHVGVSSPDRKSPPNPTAQVVRCTNCVHVYVSDGHCHEKKKKRKVVDFGEHVERERKIEHETNVTGLDLNLAL